MPTISLAQKHADLDQHNAKLLAQFARETDDHLTMKPIAGATPAGDELRLRGIPVIGGTAGAIRGTIPHVNGTRTS